MGMFAGQVLGQPCICRKSQIKQTPKTFLEMIMYSDTLHWSDISLIRDLVTELNSITLFDVITLFREVSIEHLQVLRLANGDAYSSGHLVLFHLGLAFVLNVETIFSWTCHIYGTFWVSNIPVCFYFAPRYNFWLTWDNSEFASNRP